MPYPQGQEIRYDDYGINPSLNLYNVILDAFASADQNYPITRGSVVECVSQQHVEYNPEFISIGLNVFNLGPFSPSEILLSEISSKAQVPNGVYAFTLSNLPAISGQLARLQWEADGLHVTIYSKRLEYAYFFYYGCIAKVLSTDNYEIDNSVNMVDDISHDVVAQINQLSQSEYECSTELSDDYPVTVDYKLVIG